MKIQEFRSKLEEKLSVLVLVLLVIQPVLDVFSYFLGQTGSNALSTLARFAMLAFVALLGFFISRKKKIYFFFYGAIGLFWIAHMVNCFRVGYQSPVADTTNFLRIMNFPIFTLSFLTFYEQGKDVRKSIYWGFGINFMEVVLFTLLPWALGHPVYTYETLGVGVLGWFAVPSAQSAVIVLLAPLAVLWAYKTGKYPVYLLMSAACIGLMYATGTKLTFYSIFILAGAYLFLFALNLKKKCWLYVLPLVVLAGLAFGFRAQSPMQDRENQSNYALGIYNKLVNESMENSGADAETIQDIKNGFDSEQSSEDKLEKVRRSLIGVYTDKEVYGPFLKNLHDRFGVYNVMEAYNYTTEPTILSDSRVRKKVFAKLVWQEKDFATKMLGFEYSDMLTLNAIYDLENDFPAVFYFCGYFGFALYLLFFAYFIWIILRGFALEVRRTSVEERRKNQEGRSSEKSVKRYLGSLLAGIKALGRGVQSFLTVEMGAVGMAFLLALIAAQISGNVLRRPNVTVYFAVTAATLVHLTRRRRAEKESKD